MYRRNELGETGKLLPSINKKMAVDLIHPAYERQFFGLSVTREEQRRIAGRPEAISRFQSSLSGASQVRLSSTDPNAQERYLIYSSVSSQ
jgi:hypothetical protein